MTPALALLLLASTLDLPFETVGPDIARLYLAVESSVAISRSRVEDVSRDLFANDTVVDARSFPLLLRIGILSWAELRLSSGLWSSIRIEPPAGNEQRGFPNTGLGVKARFVEEEGVELAAAITAILPTGDRDAALRGTGAEAVLLGRWRLTPALQVRANAGYGYFNPSSFVLEEFEITVNPPVSQTLVLRGALDWQLVDQLSVFAEAVAEGLREDSEAADETRLGSTVGGGAILTALSPVALFAAVSHSFFRSEAGTFWTARTGFAFSL
ncbi:MAG: hypothetical protein AAFX94_11685 [Myxococcota bacterium]